MNSISNPSEVVSFDADEALDAASGAVDGELYAFVEYDAEAYNLLYVHEFARSMYRDDEQMNRHFESVHSYVHIDFAERNLFEDELFSDLGEVRTFVTRMERMTLVRYLHGDEGVFFSLPPSESVTAAVDAIDGVVRDGS